MFFSFFLSQNIFICCLFQESDKMQNSRTFQKPPNLIWYICKIMMSQNPTIEQYQTYKSTFIYTNIYKLQFIKTQYNSHCYTCPL